MNIDTVNARIRDRLSVEWLTPSQFAVWESIHRFDGPPHKVISIFGTEGTGKTFLGWLMEREKYASYTLWSETPKPVLPRLVLDDAVSDRSSTRALRPLVDEMGIRQIILLSRVRVDEPSMPAFQLRVTDDDLACCRANLFRYLKLVIPEGDSRNFTEMLELLK